MSGASTLLSSSPPAPQSASWPKSTDSRTRRRSLLSLWDWTPDRNRSRSWLGHALCGSLPGAFWRPPGPFSPLAGRLDLVRAVPIMISRRSAPALSMPTSGPLVDSFGRVHTDLRISITDRCNLRCVYCMPEEGVQWVPRSEILTFEEIERVASVAYGLGVDSLRLTGGEPLVRASVTDLVTRLGRIGFSDLSMTTNGSGLARLVPALVAAGLQRVNISCDSLRPERFAEIRRRGELAKVLEAMDAAEQAGLPPVKVNVVVM